MKKLIEQRPKRIAIVTECPYVGIYQAIKDLSEILSKEGYDLTLIVPSVARDRYGQTQKEHVNFLSQYARIQTTPLRRKGVYIILDTINFYKKIKRGDFDTVISFTEYAGKISRLSKLFDCSRIYIHSHQCIDVFRKKGFRYFIEYLTEFLLSNVPDYYISCSPSETTLLLEKFSVPSKKILFLPNYVKARLSNYKIKNKKRFLYVGRITESKGVTRMLSVFKELDLLDELTCVGEGSLLEELREEYPTVDFQGYLPHKKVQELVNSSRYFVSFSEMEGLPYAVLESMSCGTVPIISNVPGHSDLVTDGINGFLFRDENELREKLLKVIMLDNKTYIKFSETCASQMKKLYSYSVEKTRYYFRNIHE
jgi:glycosyltransferase involved in cell wall biosynthesis